MDAVLEATRAQYDTTLTIEVTVFRVVRDSDNSSMGYSEAHHETLCTVSQGGGGNSQFIQALLRQTAM